MAISDIYNSLTFGGVNSLDYGIYISGPGVFNAPVRDVEFVDVPGRNGAIEIDKGHWNNIEVTYKAGTFGDDQSDFAQKISAFRNAIVSQIGYQRIADTYNPEEYRLGIYASGLSVDPANRNSAGEFELVFNCKPQRYLLEGEDEITVTSGQTITNPTLYESGPLVAVEGDGDMVINGETITLRNGPRGQTLLAYGNNIEYTLINNESTTTKSKGKPLSYSSYTRLFNYGDIVTINETSFKFDAVCEGLTNVSVVPQGTQISTYELIYEGGDSYSILHKFPKVSRAFPGTFYADALEVTETYQDGGETKTRSYYVGGRAIMDVPSTLLARIRIETTLSLGTAEKITIYNALSYGAISVNSTALILGHPTFLDLEIGDAYKIEGGEYIDLNRYIALPSDLPKLKPGENEITFDNTITDLKIVPRWWEL